MGEARRWGCKDGIIILNKQGIKQGNMHWPQPIKLMFSRGGGLKDADLRGKCVGETQNIITSSRQIHSGRAHKYLLLAITGPILQLWFAFSSFVSLHSFSPPLPENETVCFVCQDCRQIAAKCGLSDLEIPRGSEGCAEHKHCGSAGLISALHDNIPKGRVALMDLGEVPFFKTLSSKTQKTPQFEGATAEAYPPMR